MAEPSDGHKGRRSQGAGDAGTPGGSSHSAAPPSTLRRPILAPVYALFISFALVLLFATMLERSGTLSGPVVSTGVPVTDVPAAPPAQSTSSLSATSTSAPDETQYTVIRAEIMNPSSAAESALLAGLEIEFWDEKLEMRIRSAALNAKGHFQEDVNNAEGQRVCLKAPDGYLVTDPQPIMPKNGFSCTGPVQREESKEKEIVFKLSKLPDGA